MTEEAYERLIQFLNDGRNWERRDTNIPWNRIVIMLILVMIVIVIIQTHRIRIKVY